MGSIGGDAKTSPWYQLEPSKRPEAGLLEDPKGFESVCQPETGSICMKSLAGACPLQEEIIRRRI